MYIGLHVKYPSITSDYSETCIFSTAFPRNTQISNFVKIRRVGTQLFHADGETDGHDEANGSFFAILQTRLKMGVSSCMTGDPLTQL